MKHETIAELTRCLVGISIGQLPPEKTWVQYICKVIDTDNQALEAKYSEAVEWLEYCLVLIQGKCVENILSDGCCNSDPDKINCEGHSAEAKKYIVSGVEDLLKRHRGNK